MKTIKNTIILLIFGVICGNIYSQPTNIHAFVQDNALRGNVISTAYGLSELDIYCMPTGMPSFISAFTYEDIPAQHTYLHFRRTDACLGKNENYYYYVTSTGGPPNGNPRMAFTVTDVKEVKHFGGYGGLEVVFCGSYHGKEAYIGMLDRNMNPIGNITGYGNVAYFNSMVEVPGYGFIACGEGHNNNGVVIAVDYNLNLVSSYEYGGVLFTDVEYDRVDNYAYMAGYAPNDLCVFGIDCRQMYRGVPNPCFDGFRCNSPNFNIAWNKSGKDDIKLLSLGGKTVALAASGESMVMPGRNMGIFHINTIDGMNPQCNIYYDINGANTYFKELVNVGNYYNLLLQEDGSNNPVIVHMNPWQMPTVFAAIRIMASVNNDMQMFKRDNCQMLEILTSNNNVMHYSDCYTQMVGINCHPIEQMFSFPVNNMPASTAPYLSLNPFNAYQIPNYLPMNPGNHSHINPIVWYQGDCYNHCMRNSVVENDDILGNEELEVNSENASVMIYDNVIELQDAASYSDYMIFDIMGRQIVKSKVDKNVISTSGMPNGTYIIHLSKTSGEVEHYKFVRQ